MTRAERVERLLSRRCITAAAAAALVVGLVPLAACSGPVDLTVTNPCATDVRIQTFDGTLDVAGRWKPDLVPIADFVVPANGRKTVRDALMFVTYPEEIRIVSPVERSYLVSACEDWTVPLATCVPPAR